MLRQSLWTLCGSILLASLAAASPSRRSTISSFIHKTTDNHDVPHQHFLDIASQDKLHADPSLSGPRRTGEHVVIQGHNFTIGEYMWSGRTGEYYTVPQGWPGWDGEIVVKEFYIWYYPEEIAREVKYLKRVGQFVAEAEYNGIRWLVMQKFPGLPLTKTKAFKTAFQESRKVCDDLVDKAHGPAFMAILRYIRKYGIYHHLGPPAGNDRMLWDDNAQNPQIFDLGDDEDRDREAADDPDMQRDVALKVYMTWPNDGITYQDWCVNGQSQ